MKPAFVVRWQTSFMPAPAFWYFAKRETAEHTARGFGSRVAVEIVAVQVADGVALEDEDL